jgi:RNA polymerase sigma-70 factor (ECF subfamily)
MPRALPIAARPRGPAAASDRMSVWERARAAHPELIDAREEFCAFAAALPDLERRHVEDLYLAWACARGDEAALVAFEREVVPALARALASFGDCDEVIQVLRERMLAGARGISAYDGRAPLVVWLRVCATRIGLRSLERERRAEPLDDRRLDELAPGVDDPRLAYLRRVYGASFREAFDAAVASLAPRERNLLRLSVIDGLGIDQLAAIFHVHRSTAARRLEQARDALVAATRDRMRVTLAISESELESILRMLHSLTDLTLGNLRERGRAT